MSGFFIQSYFWKAFFNTLLLFCITLFFWTSKILLLRFLGSVNWDVATRREGGMFTVSIYRYWPAIFCINSFETNNKLTQSSLLPWHHHLKILLFVGLSLKLLKIGGIPWKNLYDCQINFFVRLKWFFK